ncbi:MAG: PAS domain-containing protein [Candidatus Woesearchaeota archaeon]|nr:PAS domain-containing protein [Candidatus Woesearchaeota archaeon]
MNLELSLNKKKLNVDFNKFLEELYGEVMILSPSFKIINVTNLFLKNNELESEDEIIGKFCYDIKTKSSICVLKEGNCPGKDILITNEPKSIVHHYLDNNEDKYNRIRLMPLFDNQGNLEYIIHGTKDITSQEITKRNKDEIYKHFIDISIPTYISNLEGKFLIANPATIDLLGYDSLEDLQSINARDLYQKPEDRIKIMNELKENGHVKNSEQRFRKKNRTYANVNLNLVLDGNKIKGVLYDIGENIVPICQYCENIRIGTQKNPTWVSPIEYLKENGFNLSHGICEPCLNEKFDIKKEDK